MARFFICRKFLYNIVPYGTMLTSLLAPIHTPQNHKNETMKLTPVQIQRHQAVSRALDRLTTEEINYLCTSLAMKLAEHRVNTNSAYWLRDGLHQFLEETPADRVELPGWRASSEDHIPE